MIEEADRYKLQNIQTDDYIHWRGNGGEKQSDILQGWRVSDGGNHTLIMRSGKTCMLSDVLARVRRGEELKFYEYEEEYTRP